MKRLGFLGIAFVLAVAFESAPARAEGPAAERDAQLQRIYAYRMRLDQERRNRDNEARAFGNLAQGISSAAAVAAEGTTLNAMRSDLRNVLIQQGDSFRCNDIEVNNGEGQAVVICNSQTGPVDVERTKVGGDLINNVSGGKP